jgi:RHS repeat-associated protein
MKTANQLSSPIVLNHTSQWFNLSGCTTHPNSHTFSLYTLVRILCYGIFGAHGERYCFAFNGKEVDNETYGAGNAYDFGARIFDSRIGRFLSIDPKTAAYPWITPYSFADNSPILNLDFQGKFPLPVIYLLYEGTVLAIEIVGSYFVFKATVDNMPPILSANRNPGYDWQRVQDRRAKATSDALKRSFNKMINDNMQTDPNDPKFNKYGKTTGIVIGVITLYIEMKSQLTDMKAELQQKETKTLSEITTIAAKGTANLTPVDNKKLAELNKTLNEVRLDLAAVAEVMDQTDELIQKEKEKQITDKYKGKDNTIVIPSREAPPVLE